jgi:hypothetical protein
LQWETRERTIEQEIKRATNEGNKNERKRGREEEIKV